MRHSGIGCGSADPKKNVRLSSSTSRRSPERARKSFSLLSMFTRASADSRGSGTKWTELQPAGRPAIVRSPAGGRVGLSQPRGVRDLEGPADKLGYAPSDRRIPHGYDPSFRSELAAGISGEWKA